MISIVLDIIFGAHMKIVLYNIKPKILFCPSLNDRIGIPIMLNTEFKMVNKLLKTKHVAITFKHTYLFGVCS